MSGWRGANNYGKENRIERVRKENENLEKGRDRCREREEERSSSAVVY